MPGDAVAGAKLVRRDLGLIAYGETFAAMRSFTASRQESTPDEVWLLEHPPVFTLGQAGRDEHVLAAADIPVVRSNRGGQVTYHGPGQLVAYTLIDIARAHTGIRDFVTLLEQLVIELVGAACPGACAARRNGAPGVFVDDAKVAALGLRVQRGRAYHGLAINVDLDLEPFTRINPCGYAGLVATSLRTLGSSWSVARTADDLSERLAARLSAEVVTAGSELPPAEVLQ